ncbi:MAG TPA: hypothetical protein VEQ42_02795 [Pyrinomonadaceae bacterium]|nr:hypothetical protein [Pyrinomonadaceae bacterium]
MPQKSNVKASARRAALKAKTECAGRTVRAVQPCPKRKATARAAKPKASAASRVKCKPGEVPRKLAFGQVIKRKQYRKGGRKYKGFRTKALHIARRLGISLNHLMTVMYFESFHTFDPAEDRSGAIGLIQFTPIVEKELHTILEELRKMSPLRQLSYVEAFFRNRQDERNNDLKRIENLYLAALWPMAVNLRLDEPFTPRGKQADELYVPGTTYMTRRHIRKVMNGYLREGLRPENYTTYCVPAPPRRD